MPAATVVAVSLFATSRFGQSGCMHLPSLASSWFPSFPLISVIPSDLPPFAWLVTFDEEAGLWVGLGKAPFLAWQEVASFPTLSLLPVFSL